MNIFYLFIGTYISVAYIYPAENRSLADLTLPESPGHTTAAIHADSSKWTADFLELQKAITTGNKSALKSFIDFPIKNKGNEIWYIADSRLVMEIDPKEIKPFTEADYDKYFSSIFAMDLRKTFEKLDAEEFFRTGKSTGPEIEVVKGSKSKLKAIYDKGRKRITLSLFSTGKDFSAYAIIYEFDIMPEQKIKFRQVYLSE